MRVARERSLYYIFQDIGFVQYWLLRSRPSDLEDVFSAVLDQGQACRLCKSWP